MSGQCRCISHCNCIWSVGIFTIIPVSFLGSFVSYILLICFEGIKTRGPTGAFIKQYKLYGIVIGSLLFFGWWGGGGGGCIIMAML